MDVIKRMSVQYKHDESRNIIFANFFSLVGALLLIILLKTDLIRITFALFSPVDLQFMYAALQELFLASLRHNLILKLLILVYMCSNLLNFEV